MKHLLLQGWLFVAIDAASIAVGGVCTTLGWNKLNLRSRLRAIVSGVAREWEINDTLLNKEPLFVSNDTNVLGSLRLYPRFKSFAVDSGSVTLEKHNKLLVPTRNGEAPLLAAQRRR